LSQAPENLNNPSRFGFRWAIPIIGVGIALIILAIAGGKDLDFPELAYDFGVATITLGIIELLFLRALQSFANRETASDRARKNLQQVVQDVQRFGDETLEKLEKLNIINADIDWQSRNFDMNSIKEDLHGLLKLSQMHERFAEQRAGEVLDRLGPIYQRVVTTSKIDKENQERAEQDSAPAEE
jgi:uncharacterized protein YoxC